MTAATWESDREGYLARVRARLRGEAEPSRLVAPPAPEPRATLPVEPPHWSRDAVQAIAREDGSIELQPSAPYDAWLEQFDRPRERAVRALEQACASLDVDRLRLLVDVARAIRTSAA